MYCNICNKYKKPKKTKIPYIFEKILSLSIFYSNFDHEYQKIFEDEESTEILKNLGLLPNIEEYQKIYNHVWGKHKSRI